MSDLVSEVTFSVEEHVVVHVALVTGELWLHLFALSKPVSKATEGARAFIGVPALVPSLDLVSGDIVLVVL